MAKDVKEVIDEARKKLKESAASAVAGMLLKRMEKPDVRPSATEDFALILKDCPADIKERLEKWSKDYLDILDCEVIVTYDSMMESYLTTISKLDAEKLEPNERMEAVAESSREFKLGIIKQLGNMMIRELMMKPGAVLMSNEPNLDTLDSIHRLSIGIVHLRGKTNHGE